MKIIISVFQSFMISAFLLFLVQCSNPDKSVSSSNDQQVDLGFDVKKLNSDRPNLNISILLDLSDRISPQTHPDPTMDYYKRDIGYISSVSVGFLTHIMNKQVRVIDDRMQIFFDPLPANQDINNIVEQLKVELDKSNITTEKLIQVKSNYDSLTSNIYHLAIEANYYPGSDIWGFFRRRVKDYCIRNDYRNILVIITDGYLYHDNTRIREGNRSSYLTSSYIRQQGLNKSDWENRFMTGDYGFIKATSNLENLEVLVLGLNPNSESPYEEDLMIEYWSKWLEEMGVSYYELKTTDLPSNLDERIKEFIWKN